MNIHIEVIAEPDHFSVRGNAIDSGDADYDRVIEDAIFERLEQGDVWAWASVEVYAWADVGGVIVRSDSEYLGGCCYEDAAEFVKVSGYYDDMAGAARSNLLAKIESMKTALQAA